MVHPLSNFDLWDLFIDVKNRLIRLGSHAENGLTDYDAQLVERLQQALRQTDDDGFHPVDSASVNDGEP